MLTLTQHWGQLLHPSFLPRASPYKVWILPLKKISADPSQDALISGQTAGRVIVGMLTEKELNYTIAPSGGWGPFTRLTPAIFSKLIQLGGSIGAVRSIWDRTKRAASAMGRGAAEFVGVDKSAVEKMGSAGGRMAKKVASLGNEFFTEQVYSGGSNYLGLQGLELLFTTENDARRDVHIPLARLAHVSAQKVDEHGFLYAPFKVSLRAGFQNRPFFRLHRAVIHSLIIKHGLPLDPNGYPTWGTATFSIESARVVSTNLIAEAFGVKDEG